jgi:Na+(H+)/acetate symporter ActP
VALGANLVFSLFWQVVDMSAWQNIAATPQGDRRSALWWSIGWILVFPGLCGTVIGLALSALKDTATTPINDSNILNALVEIAGGNVTVGLLVVAAFAASMLSTIDGYALAASQASTWDLIFPEKVRYLLGLGSEREPNIDDAKVLAVGRVLVLFLAMLGAAAVLGLVLGAGVSLFDLVYAVVVAQMSLVGPVLFCLRRPKGNRVKLGYLPTLAGLVLGGGCVLARLAGHDQLYTWAPVVAAGASLLWTLGLSLLPRDPAEAVPCEAAEATEGDIA